MKKILLLLAIIVPFVFTSCGDDKDEPKTLEQQLIGEWVESTDFEIDLFNLKFNTDHTGKLWVTDLGVTKPGSESNFTWSLTGSNLVIEASDGEIANSTISITDNVLKIVQSDGDVVLFKKVS